MKEPYETKSTSIATFLKCRGHNFTPIKENNSIKFKFNDNEVLQKDLKEYRLDGYVPVLTWESNRSVIIDIIKELMI